MPLNAWLARAVCLTLFLGFGTRSEIRAQSAGTAPAALSISPPKLDFGSQAVDVASPPQAVGLSNPGSADVGIEVLISGIDFSQTNNCGSTLAAGAKCTVHVIFKPAVSGPRVGTLNITGANPAVSHIVVLSGSGT